MCVIEPVEPEELAREKVHFLPHRSIFTENSTTRIRPVFDASAKERNSGSLNDSIEKGPNYLELIPKLLNRFRQGKYGVISNIRVNEVRKLTDPEAWRHIQGKFNPADLPSRGCNPKALLKFHWWEGHDWLKLLHEEWPASEIKPDIEIVISERRTVLPATTLTFA
ncbi:uncharacterized protein TNCV_4311371 [Trichonephila clavipes]|nr:uncharacterized protein TNCV_4311371 [Trichonephila clavipes]